jgi:hypothetical protein
MFYTIHLEYVRDDTGSKIVESYESQWPIDIMNIPQIVGFTLASAYQNGYPLPITRSVQSC